MRRSKFLYQGGTVVSVKSRGHAVGAPVRLLRALSAVASGQQDDHCTRAALDSPAFSVCSVTSSRQRGVAVSKLAAALGTDKAALTLSLCLQLKCIILQEQ